jgi:hypothetical protein
MSLLWADPTVGSDDQARGALHKEIRRSRAKYSGGGDQVEPTARIVFVLILFGLLVLFMWLTRALAAYQPLKVGVSPPAFVERDLRSHRTPPKLGWNWWAFFLGPIWYIAEGLWVHAIILILLIGLSGGILLPFTMIYSGAKATETLEDSRLARHSFY